jgi:hypothetical protein
MSLWSRVDRRERARAEDGGRECGTNQAQMSRGLHQPHFRAGDDEQRGKLAP